MMSVLCPKVSGRAATCPTECPIQHTLPGVVSAAVLSSQSVSAPSPTSSSPPPSPPPSPSLPLPPQHHLFAFSPSLPPASVSPSHPSSSTGLLMPIGLLLAELFTLELVPKLHMSSAVPSPPCLNSSSSPSAKPPYENPEDDSPISTKS